MNIKTMKKSVEENSTKILVGLFVTMSCSLLGLSLFIVYYITELLF